MKTALLPAPPLPATVMFQPDPAVVSSTAIAFIVALTVCAAPLSVTVGRPGLAGAMSKPNAPVPGFSATVTASQGMLAEVVNVFVPVLENGEPVMAA